MFSPNERAVLVARGITLARGGRAQTARGCAACVVPHHRCHGAISRLTVVSSPRRASERSKTRRQAKRQSRPRRRWTSSPSARPAARTMHVSSRSECWSGAGGMETGRAAAWHASTPDTSRKPRPPTHSCRPRF